MSRLHTGKCEQCGADYTGFGKRFCSAACKIQNYVKENTKAWKGGKLVAQKRYRISHAEEAKVYRKKRYHENKEAEREYQRKWRLENPEKYKAKMRKDNLARTKQPNYKLDNAMGTAVWYGLRTGKSNRKWEALVGYNVAELARHLEGQFDENMSWDNYGTYWWVDHIKPRSAFKYTSAEDSQFKECWAINNLQPLEKMANIKKGGVEKYEIPSSTK